LAQVAQTSDIGEGELNAMLVGASQDAQMIARRMMELREVHQVQTPTAGGAGAEALGEDDQATPNSGGEACDSDPVTKTAEAILDWANMNTLPAHHSKVSSE
jgi:hypothetical protein